MESPHPKLSRGLERAIVGVQDTQHQMPIIVRYAPTRQVMRHRVQLRGVRESYTYRLVPFVAMHATVEAIHQIEADPEVVRVYEDLPVHAYLDTAIPQVRVPVLWNEGITGEGVRIAIVDTGMDAEHPDFQGRIAAVTDFTGEGPGDPQGHGTHCASIAAGSGAASGGRYRGAAPKTQLYAAKVLRSDGEGMMSDVMAGIEWAVDRGVQVISLSLGGPGPTDGSDALCETCDAAVNAGIVICVAAGNDGPNQYTVGSPGSARNVITIGACNDQDRIANFSSRGPTADGRLKPDVVLPGVNIAAARAKGTSMGTAIDQYYTSASGTSMATPLAAGICALLLAAEPTLTPLDLKARLMASAVSLGASPYAQGSGRVDSWRAHHPDTQPPLPPTPTPPNPGPTPGQGCLPAMLRALFWGRRG